VQILETRFWEKLVEGSFWENLENKLKRRGPKSLAAPQQVQDGELKFVRIAATWKHN
jgi:hypothetical protein